MHIWMLMADGVYFDGATVELFVTEEGARAKLAEWRAQYVESGRTTPIADDKPNHFLVDDGTYELEVRSLKVNP